MENKECFNVSEYAIIKNVILDMDKPFDISDLFIRLHREYNIEDKTKILVVLSVLVDCGLVDYSEIKCSDSEDYWAYQSVLSMK